MTAMRRRTLVLALGALLVACTQDFGVFEPDAGVVDASSDTSVSPDATLPDGATPDAAVPDAALDAPKDGALDAPKDTGGDGGCTGLVYGGHCYFLVGSTLDFDTAKNACIGAGAHLVTLTTSGEQTAVQALGTGTQRWIGLYRAGGPPNDGSFAWINGEPRGGFASWAASYPQGGGQCAHLLANGGWANAACSDLRDAICERP